MSEFFMDGKVRFPNSVKQLMVPLDTLTQFPGNPNNGDLEKLTESIKVNGFTTVITYDAKTRQIVAGNHRWQALHGLGATHIPAIGVEYDSSTGAKKFLIGDNRVGQLAQIEEAGMLEMLEGILLAEGNVFGTGYEDSDLLAMRDALENQGGLNESGFAADEGPGILGIFTVEVTYDSKEERDNFVKEISGWISEENIKVSNL